ncbi:MAG: glycine cleavage T C-terminal barrel domain-containing protein [Gemmatimonadota bacterium]
MSHLFPDEESGVSFQRVAGVDVIQNFGDPEAEYRAAVEGVAVRDRGHRAQWSFSGRQPVEMLAGVVTGRMPDPLEERELGVQAGSATYHTVLTPKGKIVADLRLWRADDADGIRIRADLSHAAAPALEELFARTLPPRLVRRQDHSADTGMISLLGPGASRMLSAVVLGLRVEDGELDALQEGEIRILDAPDSDRVLVVRVGDLSVPAFDVVGERDVLRSVWRRVFESGAVRVGRDTWDTLRLEAGRPAFASELADDVIPVEAGIHDRAIDYQKGCYTGQEVIVRIRDRGRVNRHLRRLALEIDAPLPGPGTELFGEGQRSVGQVTSAADSPRQGKLALAYVRREVEPGQTVHVGTPDGPEARVEAGE